MKSVSKQDEKIRIYNPVRSRISFLFLAATTAQEGHIFVCVCVHTYVGASMRAYVCACVRAYVCACVRAFVHAFATYFKVSIEVVNCFDFLFLFFF